MRKLLLLVLIFLVYNNSKGQISNDLLEYRIRPDTLKSRNLEFGFYNFNFFENYEYFNDFQDGLTLFGTQLEPRLTYYPNSKLAVTAGIHLRKDFGKDGINKTYPIFTLIYRNKNTRLINGAIEGNIYHRYIDPMFDFERKITNPVEYGTQLVVEKPSLFLDAFVNWNKMIERNSTEQEEIFAGLSSDITLYENETFKASLPAQLFLFHRGGQIDVNPDPLKTLVNTAFGFKLNWNFDRFVNQVSTENFVVTFSDLSPTKEGPYKNGLSFYFNAGFSTQKYGSLFGSFWEGSKYVSPVGTAIYQSVSQQIDNPGYFEDTRRLFILRYAYQRKLVSNFYLDLRFEPVFDLKSPGSKSMEFSHSLFLLYKQDFKLFTRK